MSGFLDFAETEQQSMLRDILRRYLAEHCASKVIRDVLEGRQAFAAPLWRGLAELGYVGAAIPEAYGGAGLGAIEQCVIAEELGRALAPVPSFSSHYLYGPLIQTAGSETQKAAHLPPLARADAIGTFAHLELSAKGRAQPTQAYVQDGMLHGVKDLAPDGGIADSVIVLARDGAADADMQSLFLVDLKNPSISRDPIETIDPTRRYARLRFGGVAAERIGAKGRGQALADAAMRRAAVFVAFEQIGGAEEALSRACAYARGRYAFGRPIGSFQAVKQLLADMYVSLRIAQANAAYAAWALASGAPDFELAAARAHFSATHAFRHCAADAIQVHGGAGFMWEVDMHLFFRRAELLAQCLGGATVWAGKLVRSRENIERAYAG